MKRYILTLLAVMLTAVCGFAQLHNSIEIDENSFVAVQTDAISGVAIDKIGKDHSQRECARIKMRINRMTSAEIGEISVRPRGGNVEVMKCVVAGEGNGLIIELTAKEPTRFYITHPKYGDSNEVSLNLVGNKEYRINAELRAFQSIVVESNIVGADVYIDEIFKGQIGDDYRLTISNISRGEHSLRVVHGAQQLNELIDVSDTSIHFRANLNTATSRPQYVVFEVVPRNAILVIDHKSYVLDSDGCTMVMLNNGTYNYQVSAKDYHDEKGEFTVSGAKVDKRVELKPAFGWLNIAATGTLKDANIFVDNTLIGKTPISRSQLSSGTHHVRIVKDMYVTYEDSITISDGQELRYSASLAADFATVTITADAGSDIYVNDALKGKSPWTGTLSTGTYIFEARKQGHRTTSLTKNISAEPAQQSYKLDAPTPIMGTINVMCTPLKADVYVDGKMVGTTPLMHEFIIGKHKITLRKEGYADHEQTITVEDGKVTDVTATLSEQKKTETLVQNNAKVAGTTYFEIVKGIRIKMIFVEGGTFAMGSTSGNSDESPVHNVTLDSYYIGEAEINQAQWRAIMGSNPSGYTADNYPVVNVSWEDAQEFCKKLSELTGKKYVLPTEAQWEYAARGGNKSKGYTYSGSNSVDEVAEYGSAYHSSVKSKKPNELGIYDMSGNVCEWCSDWYGSSYYSSSPQTNPQGPSSGSCRIVRGGSWRYNSSNCRVANREYYGPSFRGNICGFRVVCLPEGSNGFNGANVTATLSEQKKAETQVQNNAKVTGATYTETVNGLNLKMILVEGGTFAMGSTGGSSVELPVHNVTLDSYYIGETEITQAQWRAIMGTNPSKYTGDNRPVESVSWNEAQEFCKKLSALTGKKYVLPTEAQWEYAARGGNKSKGYTYSGSNSVGEVAVYYDNSSNGHSNVKSKKPNELGIYDMSGNVWEWCSDWFGNYNSSSQTNPQGPSSGSARILRGCCYAGPAWGCSVASRSSYNPSSRESDSGFRVVCLPEGSNGFNGANVTATLSEQKKAETQVQNNAKVTGATYTETVNGLNLKMILVEGGKFSMGSTSGDSDEKPVHNVTLDSYYIGETEITQAQWRAIMGSNPSSYTGDNRPVESVSWEDAQEFCKKLSALTGKKYVLPTEAQWEYAARGGNKSKGYTYSGSNNVYDVAVYYDNRGNGHSNVKSKKPNELGIYDMSGNVYEWCSDWYNDSYYSSSHKTNPQGPSSGGRRVLRGGSWSVYAINCRVADRINNYPSDRYGTYGFRVVCLSVD